MERQIKYKSGNFIRLLGVKVDNLIQKDEVQISLFSKGENEKQEKLDKTMDEIREIKKSAMKEFGIKYKEQKNNERSRLYS